MTTAHPGLIRPWAGAHRVLLAIVVLAVAVVATGVTWAALALSSSGGSAATDLPPLQQITDTCSGARPGTAC